MPGRAPLAVCTWGPETGVRGQSGILVSPFALAVASATIGDAMPVPTALPVVLTDDEGETLERWSSPALQVPSVRRQATSDVRPGSVGRRLVTVIWAQRPT